MVRLALIGTGRMAAIHFHTIHNHPTATCNFVLSSSQQRAQQFIAENGGNTDMTHAFASNDWPELLQDKSDEIDGVVIASHSPHHFEQVKHSLLCDKPVFVEKPIAENVEQIDALNAIAAARSAGCNRSSNGINAPLVGYQRRFDANIQHVYRTIHEDRVLIAPTSMQGALRNQMQCIGGIEKIVSTSKDPNYPDIDYMSESINCFYDSIIHDIDTVCFLSRQFPHKVYTAAHAHYDGVAQLNDYDRVFITLHFESGCLAMIDWCRRSGYSYDQRLSVLGYNGMIEVANDRQNLCLVHSDAGTQIARPKEYFIERYMSAYQNEMRHFIDTIQGRKSDVDETSTTWQQIRNVCTICEAAQKSAQTGNVVDIEYHQYN